MVNAATGNRFDAGDVSADELRGSQEQRPLIFDVDLKEHRSIHQAKPVEGSSCPDLTIVEHGNHGGVDDSSIKPSPAKKWLDAENDKAMNGDLPPSTTPLTLEQRELAQKALILTSDLVDKMKKDDFSFLQNELPALEKLFGGSPDSLNAKLSPQSLREVEASIDSQLQGMGVRIVTSDTTGQTYLGMKDPESSPDSPKYQRWFSIGGAPDCSKYQYPPD